MAYRVRENKKREPSLELIEATPSIETNTLPALQEQEPPHSAATLTVQPKLTLGSSGDVYEKQADDIANTVTNHLALHQSAEQIPMPAVQLKPQVAPTTSPSLNIDSNTETVINQARGQGQPLAKPIRQPLEQAFGTDFSDVRIHTGLVADTLNQSLHARAFTTGRDIFFRQNEYTPHNQSGQELLAHELTHVMQQAYIPERVVQRNGPEEDEDAAYLASFGMAPVTASASFSRPAPRRTNNPPPSPLPANIQHAYQHEGVMVRKLYDWSKEMPFLLDESQIKGAKAKYDEDRMARLWDKGRTPAGNLSDTHVSKALTTKTTPERNSNWFRSVAMIKQGVAQGPYSGGLWLPPDENKGSQPQKSQVKAPGLIMSTASNNVTLAQFDYQDAGSLTTDRTSTRATLNKQQEITNWEAIAKAGSLPKSPFTSQPSPYNEVLAHFSADDIIAIFMSEEDKTDSKVIQEAQNIQSFMNTYLQKSLPIVIIDATRVAGGDAPKIKNWSPI